MVHNQEFLAHAIANGLDTSYNSGSKFYNSVAARVAYYLFKGEINV